MTNLFDLMQNIVNALNVVVRAQDRTVRVDKQNFTEEQKAQARENIGVVNGSGGGSAEGVEPSDDDIPKVFFGSAFPQNKTDAVMTFRYVSKTMDISGYCKTKAQGNSSMSYPKKNQTVKLYRDADCTEKLEIDFKGWGYQNKFCFKANWIDITHARNIVSARLWGDVVKSRANYVEIPELLRTSPNMGAIDGFPVKVYTAGVYQGRYTINIPKDAWMANMDDDLDKHCILCGENYVSGCFRAVANIDGSDWSDEVHDIVPASIKTRWNEAINFVMTSTDAEFVAGIGVYFDINSLIDYYLFGLVSCGLDGFGKNQLYMTYDGQKWFATMYDMDSTWGLYFTGSVFVSDQYARNEFQDFKDGEGNLLYIRLASLFVDEIKARWEELNSDALSIDNIINRFERFTDICPPWLVEEDFSETTASGAFTGIPSQNTNNIQQLREYAINRIKYVNSLFIESTELLNMSERIPADIVFCTPTEAIPIPISYGTYIPGMGRTGYINRANVESVSIVGDRLTYRHTSGGYGVGFPVKLEKMGKYNLKANLIGDTTVRVCVVYYNESQIYSKNTELVRGGKTVDSIFTAEDYPFAFIQLAVDSANPVDVTFTDVSLTKVEN